MPSVSVILPIYNVEPYLEQCLLSVTNQTLKDIEIICIDDGSTDSSSAIVDRFAARDHRLHVVHKENGGYGKAINTGLGIARGTYIGIVEPDDYIDVQMFATLFSAAKQHGLPDIVKCAYYRIVNPETDSEQVLPAFYHGSVEHVGRVFTLSEDAEFLFHHPSIWTAIYKKEFLDKHGIRMQEIPGAGWADNPWLIETLVQAQSICYIDECLYYYREFNNGSSSIVKDPSVIYNRWFDMDDIIKRLKVESPRILEGHYNRGCAYMEMLETDFDPRDPTIHQALSNMAKRIDSHMVDSSHKIPRHFKAALWYVIDKPRFLTWRLAHSIAKVVRRFVPKTQK